MILKFSSAEKQDCEELIGRQAADSEYDNLVSEDTDIYLDGELVATYRLVNEGVLKLAATLAKKSKLTKGKRTNGLSVQNAIYGYLPRNPTRCNYCRPSGASIQHPGMHDIGVQYARAVNDIYRNANPGQWDADHRKIDVAVAPEWRISDTMWSSLNVNVNFAIKYHRDTANWHGTFSNVFIYRQGCSGGDLVLPELRIAMKQKSGACIFFHGGKLIHGVTPIRATSKNAVRASIVLYTMKEMKHCKTPEDEALAHASRVDEIAKEKRLGNPKLRKRYASKIERLKQERADNV